MVNDLYGHSGGDLVIRQVADVLRKAARETDFIGRIGEDNFAVILRNTSSEAASAFAEKFRKLIADTDFDCGEKNHTRLSVSVGVTLVNKASKGPQSALAEAEGACQLAKSRGRNRVQIYETSDDSLRSHQTGMVWINQINESVRRDQLRLLSMPMGKLDFLLGYAIAFGLVAAVQSALAVGLSVWLLDLDVPGVAALFDTARSMNFYDDQALTTRALFERFFPAGADTRCAVAFQEPRLEDLDGGLLVLEVVGTGAGLGSAGYPVWSPLGQVLLYADYNAGDESVALVRRTSQLRSAGVAQQRPGRTTAGGAGGRQKQVHEAHRKVDPARRPLSGTYRRLIGPSGGVRCGRWYFPRPTRWATVRSLTHSSLFR